MRDGVQVNGLRIAQARHALPRDTTRPVSQAKFAEMIGLHTVSVNRLERGKARASLDTLGRISSVTGLPIQHFLITSDTAAHPARDKVRDAVDNLVDALMEAAGEARLRAPVSESAA